MWSGIVHGIASTVGLIQECFGRPANIWKYGLLYFDIGLRTEDNILGHFLGTWESSMQPCFNPNIWKMQKKGHLTPYPPLSRISNS